ncbi:MAG: hypothetical protein ACHQ0Y_13605 [Thermodesulfovibrionales bacterium]
MSTETLGEDLWLFKLDKDGNIQWQKTYGGIADDWANSLQQTTDGGYIVAGTTYSFGDGFNDGWILKLDANGNIQWQKTYGGTVQSILQTADGGYIVAGSTSIGADNGDAWILKLDGNGNIQWQKAIGNSAKAEGAKAVRQTPDGGYIVAGDIQTVFSLSSVVLQK